MEDHWDMIPLLERDAAGTLGFADLWAQQNEHRYVVPWLFMIGLARLTRWNIATELLLNIAFSLATLGVLAALIVRTCRGPARALAPWLWLVASLMTFSQVKWENWLWGMSQPAFASALAACVSIALLAWLGPTISGVALAMLAAIAGVLSFANDFVLFALVPLGVVADSRAPLRRRGLLALGAVFVGAAVTLLYLRGLVHPAKHPDPWLFVKRPFAFVGYVLAYLGAPLGWPETGWSIAWGAVGALALIAATVWLLGRAPVRRVDVLPWLLLSLWVSGSGALAGIGRLGMGIVQAVSSRYTTISTFFWVSVAVVVGLAVLDVFERRGPSDRRTLSVLTAAVLAVVGASASYATVWARTDAWVGSVDQSHWIARECVRFYREAPDPCLAIMHHSPALVRQRAQVLERLRLGPLAVPPSRPPLAAYERVEGASPPGGIDGAWVRVVVVRFVVGPFPEYRATELSLTGWAKDPATGRAPQALVFVVDGVVLEEVPLTSAAEGGDRPRWEYRINAFRLPRGGQTLEAYAVLEGRRIAKLGVAPVGNLGS